MSGQMDVNTLTFQLGAFSGATEIPLVHLPTLGGGITVLDCALHGNGAGTIVGGQIVVMTDPATGGTPAISGTVGSFAGTIVLAAGVVHKLTVSTPYVGGTCWLGFDQTSGTAAVNSLISLSYVMGK